MRLRGTGSRIVAVNAAAKRLRTIFVLVPCAFMIAMLALPAVNGLILSFDHHGPSLANYRFLFDDSMFRRALANNLLIPFASVIVEFILGLSLALTLTAGRKRSALIDTAAILPFAIPEIVILTLARYICMPRGYLNGAIMMTGMPALPWLSPRSPLAMLTVILVDAWHVTPVVMLMLMAGLQTIPAELYEAARLDGAGTLATFRFVTLPMLTPAIIGALILRGVDALRIFSTVLVLTGPEGVPVLSTYSYSLWDDAQKPHEAMAASMILALMVTAIGVGGFMLTRRHSRADRAIA
ncbi:carbohydrate ABC transporter permease [Candidatus Binatus sp.]|uniref:carbohydrate ABC transporter permease n=1 Tax=Candidatus Binatus sp. TaxID=2811406 RepID=UPI003CC6DAE2